MAENKHGHNGKTVLVAFDGSEHAKYALKFYADKVHMESDELILVYCVEVSDIIQAGNVVSAPFSMDHELFKDLVQKEVKRIEGELIEFAKYMRTLHINGVVKKHTCAQTRGRYS